MKFVVIFLTFVVSTKASDNVLTHYHHEPNNVLRPDGDEMVVDGWSLGATTSNGFHPNILHYKPVLVRKGNGLIQHVNADELNRLLHDITFRVPGPRDDHVPYEEHYNVPAIHPGNPQAIHGIPHAQYGNSPHAQIFGEGAHSEHGAGGMPGGFPGGFAGGMPGTMPHPGSMSGGHPGTMPHPGGMPGGAPHGEIPNRHISSGSRSNSELSVGSRGSRGSSGSLRSRSSRRAGEMPNMPYPGGANAAHGGIPNVPRGSPHVQFAGSGSLEHYADSPRSQMSGGSQGSGRSASGRNKSRLGAGGMPEGFPGGMSGSNPGGHPGGMPGGMPGAGPHAGMPSRHISSGSRSNSELSVGSRGSRGSQGSQGSQGSLASLGSLGSRGSRGSLASQSSRRAGEIPNMQHPGGSRQPPEFPGGYPYEGSEAGSQDGYDSAGSGRSHQTAKDANMSVPPGEKKPKKNQITNLLKKLKIGSSKKSSST